MIVESLGDERHKSNVIVGEGLFLLSEGNVDFHFMKHFSPSRSVGRL